MFYILVEIQTAGLFFVQLQVFWIFYNGSYLRIYYVLVGYCVRFILLCYWGFLIFSEQVLKGGISDIVFKDGKIERG